MCTVLYTSTTYVKEKIVHCKWKGEKIEWQIVPGRKQEQAGFINLVRDWIESAKPAMAIQRPV